MKHTDIDEVIKCSVCGKLKQKQDILKVKNERNFLEVLFEKPEFKPICKECVNNEQTDKKDNSGQ